MRTRRQRKPPPRRAKRALRNADTVARALRLSSACGAVAEWSKALAWKVSIRQKRIEGSNPSRSATGSSAGVRRSPPGLTFFPEF